MLMSKCRRCRLTVCGFKSRAENEAFSGRAGCLSRNAFGSTPVVVFVRVTVEAGVLQHFATIADC